MLKLTLVGGGHRDPQLRWSVLVDRPVALASRRVRGRAGQDDRAGDRVRRPAADRRRLGLPRASQVRASDAVTRAMPAKGCVLCRGRFTRVNTRCPRKE
jgi:hypothetical protein